MVLPDRRPAAGRPAARQSLLQGPRDCPALFLARRLQAAAAGAGPRLLPVDRAGLRPGREHRRVQRRRARRAQQRAGAGYLDAERAAPRPADCAGESIGADAREAGIAGRDLSRPPDADGPGRADCSEPQRGGERRARLVLPPRLGAVQPRARTVQQPAGEPARECADPGHAVDAGARRSGGLLRHRRTVVRRIAVDGSDGGGERRGVLPLSAAEPVLHDAAVRLRGSRDRDQRGVALQDQC